MERITDDLIMEILTRLPVKSIVRARCVSKSWNRLISTYHRRLPPAMAGLLYDHSCPNGTTFFRTRDDSPYDGKSPIDSPDFGSVPRPRSVEILHTCNGLILCRYARTRIALCNPVARKCKSLTVPDDHDDFNFLAVGFDPHLSRRYRVLGYYRDDSNTSKYKFKIFRSETDDWADCVGTYEFEPMKSVYVNGVFYVTLPIFDDTGKVYQGFDIVDVNAGRKIALPHHAPAGGSQHLLGVSGGLLHLAMQSGDELLVWALEDADGGQWALKHVGAFGAMRAKLAAVGGLQFGYELGLAEFDPDADTVYLHLPWILISYDLATGDLEVLSRMLEGVGQNTFHPFSPCYSADDL